MVMQILGGDVCAISPKDDLVKTYFPSPYSMIMPPLG